VAPRVRDFARWPLATYNAPPACGRGFTEARAKPPEAERLAEDALV
jgi:hypothetical protein